MLVWRERSLIKKCAVHVSENVRVENADLLSQHGIDGRAQTSTAVSAHKVFAKKSSVYAQLHQLVAMI
jgi:hypothetical protein